MRLLFCTTTAAPDLPLGVASFHDPRQSPTYAESSSVWICPSPSASTLREKERTFRVVLCAALAVVRRRSAGGEGVEGASAGVGAPARARAADLTEGGTANAPANARARAPTFPPSRAWNVHGDCSARELPPTLDRRSNRDPTMISAETRRARSGVAGLVDDTCGGTRLSARVRARARAHVAVTTSSATRLVREPHDLHLCPPRTTLRRRREPTTTAFNKWRPRGGRRPCAESARTIL